MRSHSIGEVICVEFCGEWIAVSVVYDVQEDGTMDLASVSIDGDGRPYTSDELDAISRLAQLMFLRRTRRAS